jgi:hypothetical protein
MLIYLNDELENMCKELVVAYFKLLFQRFHKGTEEIHVNLVHDDWYNHNL